MAYLKTITDAAGLQKCMLMCVNVCLRARVIKDDSSTLKGQETSYFMLTLISVNYLRNIVSRYSRELKYLKINPLFYSTFTLN